MIGEWTLSKPIRLLPGDTLLLMKIETEFGTVKLRREGAVAVAVVSTHPLAHFLKSRGFEVVKTVSVEVVAARRHVAKVKARAKKGKKDGAISDAS